MAATRASHRPVVAIVLLLAMAAGTAAQVVATEPGVGTGSADGRSHGAATTTTTTDARVPLAVTVRCTKVHVVKAGETCASVAPDFRLTIAQFMMLNQEHYTYGE